MVGGKGTRLRPLTDHRPKPLLSVLGVPCVEYVIRRLVESGVQEIIMACGYKSEDMVRSIGDGSRFGISIDFSYEDQPAGTAGSVKLLEDRLNDTFLVASGDVLADVDLVAMGETHRENDAAATMALTTVDKPTEFGIVGLDREGRIERFLEKPSPEEVFSNLINAGIYILEREVMDRVPSGQFYDFSRNLFPDLMSQGARLQGHVLQGFWKDIGRPADLLQANLYMASLHGDGDGRERSTLTSSNVDVSSAVLPGCRIHGSSIECSVIERNAVITDSKVTRSLLLSDVVVGRNSCIIDSIIGNGCRIGESVRIQGCVIADGISVGDGEEMSSRRVGGRDEL
ncbi:MAG: NDP-sugar synthase [Candidatus Methanomethylophilaceae archaeon]